MNTISLDPDHHSVGPDLDPNCLQRLPAVDKSQRVKVIAKSVLIMLA